MKTRWCAPCSAQDDPSHPPFCQSRYASAWPYRWPWWILHSFRKPMTAFLSPVDAPDQWWWYTKTIGTNTFINLQREEYILKLICYCYPKSTCGKYLVNIRLTVQKHEKIYHKLVWNFCHKSVITGQKHNRFIYKKLQNNWAVTPKVINLWIL